MKHRRRNTIILWGGLAVVVAVVATFGIETVFHRASAGGVTRTATVTTGTVQQIETASGNVASAVIDDLSFQASGTVSAIDVSVGQKVKAGQKLATVNASQAESTLKSAELQLAAAKNNLSLAEAGNETPPEKAEDSQQLAAAQSQITSAQETLTSAEQTESSDKTTDTEAVTSAEDALAAAKAACAAASTTTTTTTTGRGSGTGSGSSGGSASSSDPCSEVTSDEQAVTQAESTLTATEQKDAQAVQQDQSSVTQAEDAYNSDELSIEAKRYVSPATLDQDKAQILQDEQTVTEDKKAVAETTLRSPIAGTVTAIDGTVGETVTASSTASSSTGSTSSTSSGSSGSTGSGSTGGSSSSSSTASTGSGSSSTSSGSSDPFLTVENLKSMEVTAAFAEADATKIAVGQPATVTFDALSNVDVRGKVTAISPTATVTSNVVTYDVTVALTDPPASVLDGMTTNVDVVVAQAANAVEVPSAAITTVGRVSTVEVEQGGKEVTTPVQTGIEGTTETQITSGLRAGEVVVLPTATVSSSGATTTGSTGTGTLGGGGFLGRGGGLFGGGAGG